VPHHNRLFRTATSDLMPPERDVTPLALFFTLYFEKSIAADALRDPRFELEAPKVYSFPVRFQ